MNDFYWQDVPEREVRELAGDDERFLIHYVRFWSPGLMLAESHVRRISSRSSHLKVPTGAYAWQYFDRIEIYIDGELLIGKEKNHSPAYYLGEELTHEAAVKRATADSLKWAIRVGGHRRFVLTPAGQMFPLNENDEVVNPWS